MPNLSYEQSPQWPAVSGVVRPIWEHSSLSTHSATWLSCPAVCLSRRPILSVCGVGEAATPRDCAHPNHCPPTGAQAWEAWGSTFNPLAKHAAPEMAGESPHGAEWTQVCVGWSMETPAVSARRGSLSGAVSGASLPFSVHLQERVDLWGDESCPKRVSACFVY